MVRKVDLEVIPTPGRMAPNQDLKAAREELILKSRPFSKVECDFGASKGKFLSESASLNPAVFFAGIEGISDRVKRGNKKIERLGIPNAALWRGWGKESLDELIPDGFLDTLHVSFPDPWPKRRHWFRRLVNVSFLEVAVTKLKPDGVLRLQTDHLGYFASMKEQLLLQGGWLETSWDDDLVRPVTEFETIFREKGDPIGRIAVKRFLGRG